MEKLSYLVIFITTPTYEEAKDIAHRLLNEKKVACVNIVSGVFSLFWWQGKIDSSKEALLVIKTQEKFLEEIIKLVKGIHSYKVPEIIALPIIGGNQEYLKWISESTNENP
ncbi:divalent-cation tolerance protein CutA [bacterium]|nr:divalent-cation tolerance protein CutA [bacterium]MBU0899225.1 divalent-cation tolerance protein CutA [bacterium]MBU1154050.1 divalent-cation tolerance protein CutA [bacterium]MBU1782535.1 divalent-cation tolerance protein CutA [bacterium]MBU2599382.1 divalent-cation tolerance protein CutA [bacterium]